jgi:hypothetical protein
MTTLNWLQVAAASVAAATPSLVVRISSSVAARHARALGMPFAVPRSVPALDRATTVVLAAIWIAALAFPVPPALIAILGVLGFAGLAAVGLGALGDIEKASRPVREVDQAERSAALRPRRVRSYLPIGWLVVPFVVAGFGVLLLAWRIGSSSFSRPFAGAAFILFSPVFLWLYQVWMRDEVCGGTSAGPGDEERRRRRVRSIYGMELLLVCGCLGIGHALLALDWAARGSWGAVLSVAGAILGVAGCALALSADFGRRRYRAAERATLT